MKIVLVIALIAGAMLAAHLIAAARFGAWITDLEKRLVAMQVESTGGVSPIPAIIEAFALRNGGRIGGPSVLEMIQRAQMRLAPDQPYFSLNARQLTGTRQPGFVWHAKGMINAVIPLEVIDSYVDGAGALDVRLAGSIPVARSMGDEVAKGEAMRFLAELPWNPDAILNARGLIWQTQETGSIVVSIQTSGGLASVTLQFDAAGDVIGISANDRPRSGDTPARWVGRFSDYIESGAYRFPRHGEIAWDLPDGEFVYWRGEILSVRSKDH